MSTKTISKRVALATVVALGAGVLSLVSVSSASAVGTNTTVAANANPALAVTKTLYIASANSASGVPIAYMRTADATTLTSATPAVTAAASFGLLTVGDIAGNSTPVAGTTQTATLLSNGGLSVYESTGAAGYDSIVVSGGTLTLPATATGMTLNGTATIVTEHIATNMQQWGVIVKPNAGVSSFTVSLYTDNTDATIANATSGTLSGFITVSVATASTSGTLSLTKSGIYYDAPGSQSAVTSDSTSAGTGTSAYNIVQSASIVIKDAYGAHLAASTLVTASATNGAYVKLTDNGGSMNAASASAGTASSSFTTTNGTTDLSGNVGMTVGNPTTAPLTTTVTVQVGGVTVGTKSFTFTGKVAKVVLAGAGNGLTTDQGTGTNAGNLLTVQYQDAAGNVVYPGYVGASNTNAASYPQTNVKDAGTAGAGVSIGTSTYPTPTATGTVGFTCGAINSTGTFVIDYINADGTAVVSNSVPVTCSGAAYTYTAALDKATYAPGDIATLTVTFKDSSGALAADKYTTASTTTLSGAVLSSAITGISGGTGGTAPKVTASQLTATSGVTTAGATTDVTTDGVLKYVFTVGTTAGAYQAIVDFGQVDTAGAGAAQTVAYKIVDGSTSLNDVLKGIVSLIASINKQIAALAKLVTKK